MLEKGFSNIQNTDKPVVYGYKLVVKEKLKKKNVAHSNKYVVYMLIKL